MMRTIFILIEILWFIFFHGADVENFGREESVAK